MNLLKILIYLNLFFKNHKYPNSLISFSKAFSIFFIISKSNDFFQSFFGPKLKNGAIELQVNKETQNFEYKI